MALSKSGSHILTSISSLQLKQLKNFTDLLLERNAQVNLVSRKDTDHIWERHILHSLCLNDSIKKLRVQKVLDLGTGGGFPGIPLAIVSPSIDFLLVDSRAKKIEACRSFVDQLKLSNVHCQWGRAEQMELTDVDLVVSRAVAPARQILEWCQDKTHKRLKHFLLLKGGDLQKEISDVPKNWKVTVHHLNAILEDDFFLEKKILQLTNRQ